MLALAPCRLAVAVSLVAAIPLVAQGLVVRTMPGFPNAPNTSPQKRHVARPLTDVIVWGNADLTATAGATYAWTFSTNPNVRVIDDGSLSGPVTDARFIFEVVRFELLNGSTKENLTASLVVDSPSGSGTRNVGIVIVDRTDPSSDEPLEAQGIDVDIAIANGLRWLYLRQDRQNGWRWTGNVVSYGGYHCAATAFALWAFQNQGYLVSNDPNEDIYAIPVRNGLNYIFRGAVVRTGTAALQAPAANVERGATAATVSDLNGNGQVIELCPDARTGYGTPIACAAIIASADPNLVVDEPASPLHGMTFRTVVEDTIDRLGTMQGTLGGWDYSTRSNSDMSINSWAYVAMEGAETVFDIDVPDWIKQECERSLIARQQGAVGTTGPRQFGYRSTAAASGHSFFATTGGGLAGLVLVETEGPYVAPGQLILNANDTIAAKRSGALAYLGQNWGANAPLSGWAGGNRGNTYAMWTIARALRMTAASLGLPQEENLQLSMTTGGVTTQFDWATGEENRSGQLAAPGSAREGYYSWLVRNQDNAAANVLDRGRWNLGTNYQRELEAAMSVLILTPRVFREPCPGSITIEVTQLQPARDSQLPTGSQVVLTGVAQAQSPTRPLVAVLINGQPVDSLDVHGRFFKRVTIAEGQNDYVITAIERCGQDETTHRLFGVPGGELPFSNLVDVTSSVAFRFTNTSYNREQQTLLVDAQACNRGTFPLDAPVVAVFERFDHPSQFALNPDGYGPGGRPYFVFQQPGAPALDPGGCGGVRRMYFFNPPGERIDFEVTWLALGNTAPYFVSVPPPFGNPGNPWQYDALARDDEGHPITYALQIGPGGMTIDALTGRVQWTPTAQQSGLYQVVLVASDTRGGVGRQEFSLDTRPSSGVNRPPLMTSAPPTRVGVGTTFRYQATAFDPDGDPLLFSAVTGPAGMTVQPNGLLEWPFALPGDHPVAISVVDGRGGEARQGWMLSVGTQATNPNAPILLGTPSTVAAVGDLYLHQAFAIDPDPGQTLVFRLLVSPTGMQVDPTGRISWRPGASQVGVHPVQLQVDDGAGGTAEQSWDIQVSREAGNRPPVFLSVPRLRTEQGQFYEYIALVEDPDEDIVTFSLEQAPAGMAVDPTTGRVTWTPADAGRFGVAIRAQDTRGAFGAQVFEILVDPPNQPPVITSSPILAGVVGGNYRYQVNASDPDGDPLEFRIVSGPAGMQIHRLGGLLSWLPTAIGGFPVAIEVLDGRGGRATQQFTVQVVPDTEPPQVGIQTASTQVPIGVAVRVRVGAVDNVGVVAVALTLDGSPLSLDPAGWASFVPATVRGYALVATARDAAGNVGNASLTLQAFDPSTGAPGITLVAPTPGTVITSPIDIVGSVGPTQPGGSVTWVVRVVRTATGEMRPIATGSVPVSNGILARFDPTLLPNDGYRLEIAATENGTTRTLAMPVSVAGDLKLGNYSFTVTDLSLPLAGIPIVVTRVYDSLDTAPQDFGRGWRLGLPGRVEDSAAEGGGQPQPFAANERVYVTGIDGRRVGFTFRPESIGGPFGFLLRPRFEPDPGVDDRLELTEETFVVVSGGLFFSIFEPFNPTRYRLVARTGVKFTIDEVAGLQRVEDARGNTISVTPDGLFSSLGPALRFQRDAAGRIVRITDGAMAAPAADATRQGGLQYQYDAAGNLVVFQDQQGNRTRYHYDEPAFPHYLTRIEDPLGRPLIRNVYGPDGRIVATCGPDGDPGTLQGCQQFSWDPNSQWQTMVTGNGHQVMFQTDARGNVLTLRRFLPGGQSTDETWAYENGRTVRHTLPSGATTRMVRDAQGNVVQREEQNGARWTWQYDGGRLLRHCNPLGDCLEVRHNGNGQVDRVTGPLGSARNWTFDAFGRMTEFRDYGQGGTGPVWRYAYPTPTRTEVTHPDGGVEVWQSDGQGRVVARTRRDGSGSTFQWRADGKLLLETWSDGTGIRYQYDAAGNIVAVSDGRYQVRRTFNAMGRIESETTLRQGVPLGTIGYQYDFHGNVTRISDSFGGVTSLQYDHRDQPTQLAVTSPQGDREVRWLRDPDGRVDEAQWWVSGAGGQQVATARYTYSCGSCGPVLAGIDLRTPGGSLLDQIAINRRADLSVATLTENGVTRDLVHDAQGRLIGVSQGGAQTEWFAYDAAGNRLQDRSGASSYQVGTNRLSLSPTHAFVHDPNGNVIRMQDRATGEVALFSYDGRSRCTGIRRLDSGGGVLGEIAYEYDPLNRRVARSENGVTEYTLHLGDNPALVVDAGLQVRERRVYGAQADELLGLFGRDGQFRWTLRDHVNSVVLLLRDDGTVAERFTYNLFGDVAARTGAAPTSGEEFRFGGRPFEVATGTGDYRRRLYLPAIGRFLSEDPQAPFGYAYGENLPDVLRDPSGRSVLAEYCGVLAFGINVFTAVRYFAIPIGNELAKVFDVFGDPANHPGIGPLGDFVTGLMCTVFLTWHVTWATLPLNLGCGATFALAAVTTVIGWYACPGNNPLETGNW